MSTAVADTLSQLGAADWPAITAELDASGSAATPGCSPRSSAVS